MDRKTLDAGAVAAMILLCATWGFQQVAIKAVAADMTPIFQIALRSGIAAVIIAILVLVRREIGSLGRETWWPGLAVGLLFALEFLLMGEGLRLTSAAHMSIFLYTAPIFAALGLQVRLPSERLAPIQWLGVGLAFAGIVVTFSGQRSSVDGDLSWLGDLLGIAAGASYGATTVVVRTSRLSDVPATVTLLYQLAGASLLLLVAAVLLGRTDVSITPMLIESLLFQAVVVSFVSFLAWFALLRIYLASRLGVLSFMTPVFGVAFGVLLLGERLDHFFIAGALLVLTGILVVGGRDLLCRAK